MKVDDIDVKDVLKRVRTLLDEEPNLSPALKSTLEMLILVVHRIRPAHTPFELIA